VSERRGQIAAALTGVQVGAALVATRFIVGEVGPVTLALLRYAVALAVLVPFQMRRSWVPVARGDLWPMLALGVGQFGVLVALLNWGVARVPASLGALIFATFPLLTLILAVLWGCEQPSWSKVLGTGLSIGGVALTLGGSLFLGHGVHWGGALAVFGAALTGAVCAVLYRPYLMRYPTLQVGTLAMLAAVVALAVLAVPEAPLAAIQALPLRAWSVVVFIGLSSGAGYLLWLSALRHATPTQATVLLGLSPVTAAILGVGLLGEPFSVTLLLGLLAVLAGAMLASRGRS
jgi:drug/metabolite transporter (DMT)-like permease